MVRQNQRNDSYLWHQTGKQSGTAETGTGKHRKSIKTESVNANKKRHCQYVQCRFSMGKTVGENANILLQMLCRFNAQKYSCPQLGKARQE